MIAATQVNFENALSRATSGEVPAVEWLSPLLACSDEDAPTLYRAADRVREAKVGTGVHLRGLVEFSSYCRKNCAYCGLRRDNRHVQRYRMTPNEIVTVAQEAQGLGYHTVVLQSGEDLWFTAERLGDVIRRIKATTDLAVTLSVGERDMETYRIWREVGADRFLLRIETTDPRLFQALHPDDDLGERKDCLYALKDLGYQLGSGILVGLPGQTAEMIARDVIWLHRLGVEMIGVGPFIPHPETPLKDAAGGALEQTLRLVATLRLVFPAAHIPATTAMGSLHPMGRERALKAGANVLMPNVTPTDFRPKYEIYPGKICLTDDPNDCRGCVADRIARLGRTVATGHGHVCRVACSLSGD